MDDATPTTIPGDPGGTPLGEAIRAAAAELPVVAHAPEAIRSARRAVVVIAADALADAGEVDRNDPGQAGQIVDEAAISLDLQSDRTVDVELVAPVEDRHRDLAESLGAMPSVVRAGMDDARSLARVEEAMGRAMRMRGDDPARGDARVSEIVEGILETCAARSTPVDDMDDGELMRMVEDVRDHVLG